MSDTTRQRIVDYLVAKLAEITVANGYRTDVELVEYVTRTWSEAAKVARPVLGLSITKELYRYASSNLLTVDATVSILTHVDAEAGAPKVEVLSNLIDDVIAALHDDVTCGGLSEKLILTQGMTDESDPAKQPRPIGTSLVECVVTFERTTGKTP